MTVFPCPVCRSPIPGKAVRDAGGVSEAMIGRIERTFSRSSNEVDTSVPAMMMMGRNDGDEKMGGGIERRRGRDHGSAGGRGEAHGSKEGVSHVDEEGENIELDPEIRRYCHSVRERHAQIIRERQAREKKGNHSSLNVLETCSQKSATVEIRNEMIDAKDVPMSTKEKKKKKRKKKQKKKEIRRQGRKTKENDLE